jgi:glutathione S-transferase
MWTLISATPSPYARKVRIALAEKNIPFKLQFEVPWDSTTATPQYNPLEKLPVLILDDGKTAIYESHFIMDWLETKHPEHSLMPEDVDGKLFAKQVEVVADGMCDAMVIAFFENMREDGKRSEPWKARYAALSRH